MSTSDLLAQLEQLSSLALEAPTAPDEVSGGIWDGLVNAIKQMMQKLLDSVINPIKTQVTNVYEYLKNKFTDVINQISGAVNDAIAGLKTVITGVKDTIVNEVRGVAQDVIDGVNTALGGIGDAFKEAIGWLVDKINDVVDSIKNIGATISGAIKDALKSVGTTIKEALENAIEGIGEWFAGALDSVSDWIKGVYDNIKETVTGVIETAKDWIAGVYNSIKETVTNVIESLKAAYETVRQTIEDKIQMLLNWLSEMQAKLSTFFWAQMQKVGNFLAKEVLPRLGDAIDGAKTLVKWGEKVWSLISQGKYDQAFDLVDDLFKGLGIPAPVETLHAILSAIAYFWETVRLQFVPLEVAAAKRANINLALDPISLDIAAQAVYRGKADEGDFFANATLAGVTKSRAQMVLDASRALPTPGAIQTAYLRGEISEERHDNLLEGYGYTSKDIKVFKALYFIIPPPADLIRMSVREAFTPEIAEKFGQFEDYPIAFTEWATKQGISEEWAKRYWASHWDLPSPQMGFEMLHRRIIDEDELKLLLRALDVMPYWRERLIKLSYNPITRVDLRRMYKMGVYTEEDIYNGYLDLGYSPAKAHDLTEFTKRYSAPEDESEQDTFRAMARTTYSAAYKKKLISTEEYREFLINMGYNPEDVTLLIQIDDYAIYQNEQLFDVDDYRKDLQKLTLTALSRGLINREDVVSILTDLGYEESEITLELNLQDYNRQLKLKDILIGQLHDQYVTYIIDAPQLNSILNMFDFATLEVEQLQEEWDLERNFRTKRPTFADLKSFYNKGLITIEELLNELRGSGYHEKYIPLYRQSLSTTGG